MIVARRTGADRGRPRPDESAANGSRAERLHRVAGWLLNAAAILGSLCVIGVITALVLGVRPVVLVSDSMSPAMPVGAVVITAPRDGEDLRTGDVVTVPIPGSATLVTHRITSLEHRGDRWYATLKGDANPSPDADVYDVTTQARIVIASVPAGGRILTAARSPIIVVGSIALVTLALLPTRTNPRRTTPPPGTASTPEDVEPGATGAGRSDWRDPP